MFAGAAAASYNGLCVCANPAHPYVTGQGCLAPVTTTTTTTAPVAVTCPSPATTTCSSGLSVLTTTCTAATNIYAACNAACIAGAIVSQATQAGCQAVCQSSCLSQACSDCCVATTLPASLQCLTGASTTILASTCAAASVAESTCFANCTSLVGAEKAVCQGTCKGTCFLAGCNDCCPNVLSDGTFTCALGASATAAYSLFTCATSATLLTTCYGRCAAGAGQLACRGQCQGACFLDGCFDCCPFPAGLADGTVTCSGGEPTLPAALCQFQAAAQALCFLTVFTLSQFSIDPDNIDALAQQICVDDCRLTCIACCPFSVGPS